MPDIKRYSSVCLLFLLLIPHACIADSANQPDPYDLSEYTADPADQLQSGTAFSGTKGPTIQINGQKVPSIQGNSVSPAMIIPNGEKPMVWLPEEKQYEPNKHYVDARELKLKIRELAEQLIADVTTPELHQAIALPTTFVDMNNINSTSAFGRLLAEQLYYEFNQRGFPIREYKTSPSIRMGDDGDFYLSRSRENVPIPSTGAVIIAGTYYADRQAIFVNARLIRPSDGHVLRTANLVLESSPLTKKLLTNSGNTLKRATVSIRSLSDTTTAQEATPFDRGEDIHQ